jgi:3-oxoacyl-[acyl-carrier-protein] synthase III
MGVSIGPIEYFLPKRRISNLDLKNEFDNIDIKKVENKLGIINRFIVDQNETALDLAVMAAEKLFNHFDKNNIDFIILCTQSPDYILPTSACILQNSLGLKNEIGAFDINLGCSGFIYGLGIAKSFIISGIAKSVLLITADTYSKHIHKKDKANRILFGDGAAATIIHKSEKENIFEFVYGTDGSKFDKLIIPAGGCREKYDASAVEYADGDGNIRTKNNLYMDGPGIFNFTLDIIPPLIEKVLIKNNKKLEDIDYFIFHQANKYLLGFLRTNLGIPEDKFYNDIKEMGNTVSSTIPIALKDCQIENRIKKDNIVLLAGFGVGLSWGATIIKI